MRESDTYDGWRKTGKTEIIKKTEQGEERVIARIWVGGLKKGKPTGQRKEKLS